MQTTLSVDIKLNEWIRLFSQSLRSITQNININGMLDSVEGSPNGTFESEGRLFKMVLMTGLDSSKLKAQWSKSNLGVVVSVETLSAGDAVKKIVVRYEATSAVSYQPGSSCRYLFRTQLASPLN